MTDELRNCIICGKEYKPHRYDQVTCGNKVCCRKSRIEQDYIRKRQKRAMDRERKKHGKGNNDEVIDIANTASKEGLSYGKYQEQADIERLRREGFWRKREGAAYES